MPSRGTPSTRARRSTLDKDFGELPFPWGLPASYGFVLSRLSMPVAQTASVRMAGVLESQADWSGCFGIAEERRRRIRPLPAPEEGP